MPDQGGEEGARSHGGAGGSTGQGGGGVEGNSDHGDVGSDCQMRAVEEARMGEKAGICKLRVSRAELRNGRGHWRVLRRRGLWRTPLGSGLWRARALEDAFGEQAPILLFCFIFCY